MIMPNNFCLIFDSGSRLLEAVNPSERVRKCQTEEIQKDFFFSLSSGDKARFIDFCAAVPDFRHVSGCTAIFKLFGFYGSNYAFAEKNILDRSIRVYVYIFRNPKGLLEFTSPIYLRFLPASLKISAEADSVLSPAAALIRKKAPSLLDHEKHDTDILELTKRILSHISADPVFYGNTITLIHADSPVDLEQKRKSSFLIKFSASAYTHILYALLAVMTAATHSHEILLRVTKFGFGAMIDIKTESAAARSKPFRDVTDLTCLAPLAAHCENMLAFAEYVAVKNDFKPSANFSPDTSELSITLSIAADTCSEGEFRYREPYKELYAVLLEASGLYRLLTSDG